MAYTTHSNNSPENNTSYINTGLVSLVSNNPYHPTATTVGWPSNYDLFVNKTNDQQGSVSVGDETHAVAEITADSGLYLNHKPRRGTTIAYNSGVAGGAIDTNLTDYNHGIVYFSTLPTAEVTLTYLADPDKYYGEYLTQIQDVLHELEIWAGASNTLNEGVRSADILVKNINSKINNKLPNRIHVQGLTTDISFQSLPSDTIGNTINLGNSYDTITVNAREFNVFRGTFNDGNAGDPIVVTISDHSGDTVNMSGLVNLSPTGTTRATGISYTALTGALFSSLSGRDGGANDALRVFGDTFLAGDLFTMGTHHTLNVTTTSEFNVFEDNLLVKGHSFLGNAPSDQVYISGPTTATGKITAKDNIEVTKSISFTNNNGLSVSTVDGLDASYMANRHTYMRPAGPSWCGDSVNECSIGILYSSSTWLGATTTASGGYIGNTTHASVGPTKLIDTGVAGTYLFTGTSYYANRFDDGTWIADIKSGPDAGQKVPVAKWDTSATGWVLSRSLSTNQNSGISYRIYNKYFCQPDFIAINGTTLDVSASTTSPIVGNIKGIVKVCSINTSVSFSDATAGKQYLFMSNENSDGGLGGLNSLESNPVWYTADHDVPSDRSILVAELYVTAPSTVDPDSLIVYRPSCKYDSTWVQYSSASITFHHNLGGTYRSQDYKIIVSEAGTGGTPGTIRAVPLADSAGDYYVSAITPTTMSMTVPTGTWIRVKIEV